jgi:PDZ domain-containing protein
MPVPHGPFPGSGVLGSLSRRVRTLIVAAIAFVVLLTLALTLPVPYVVLSPGPTYNTLGADDRGNEIIVINGKVPNKTSGHLNMTTVGVSTSALTAFDALSGWLLHDEVVVPKAAVYPPGQSEQQVDEQNHADFVESQDNAIAAASCELGYPQRFGVVSVTGSGPSHGVLKPTDIITSFNGEPVDDNDTLLALLARSQPGQSATIGIEREAKPRTVSVDLAQPLPGRNGASLGITVGQVCQLPFAVDLGLGNQIGGPSAGMMFALGIMDKVGTTDLTHGMFIAGTGTIDTAGQVGAIGGIQLKMIAARRAGATVFLAPAGNCGDVRGAVPDGLQVVKVATLHEAVTDLKALQAGQPVPHC